VALRKLLVALFLLLVPGALVAALALWMARRLRPELGGLTEQWEPISGRT
jgi:hypothetical protein